MFRFLSFSIRTQLLLIVLIVALPAAVLIVYTGLDQRERAFQEAEQEIGELASVIASEQTYRVASSEQLLRIISELPEVKDHIAYRLQPILVDLHRLNRQYSNLFVTDLKGNVWASALPFRGVNVSERRYFRNARATHRLSSGDYIVSKFTNKLVIALAYPYTDRTGNVAGFIVVGFDLSYYKRLLNSEELKEGKSYLLLDYKGTVLARPIDPGEVVGKPFNKDQFKRMQHGPDEDLVTEAGMDGKPQLVAIRKLQLETESVPYLFVRAAIPVRTVLSNANRDLLVNVSIFAVFLLLSLLLAWIIGKRSIADRISLLEHASNRMAGGELGVRVSDNVRGGELGRLGRTFDRMAEELTMREQERSQLIQDLQKALADIKTLHGILPICSSCKKIRNEEGVWTQLEGYISEHTNAEFSHGMCAECAAKLYPGYLDKKREDET